MTTPTPLEAARKAVVAFYAGATGEGDAFVARSADELARAAILAFIGALDGEELADAISEAEDYVSNSRSRARAILTHLKSKVET